MSGVHSAWGRALVLSLGVGALGAARAEPLPALGEDAFFGDLPVVVTVTRLAQEMSDVPASVTVIDREMIDASGVQDIPSLFRLVAGFQVAHDVDNYTSVTYHGVSDTFARRMQVLVDGRSIYTPLTGGVNWSILPLSIEDIERIEVTRGPNGVAYGANSVLGVINIITYQPKEVDGVSAKVVAGDQNFVRALLRQGGRHSDFDYRLTIEQREDGGPRDLDYDHSGTIGLHNGSALTAVTFRGDYRPNVNDYVTLQLGYTGGNLDAGMEADRIGRPPRNTDAMTHYQQLRWQRIFSSDEELSVQFYHDYFELVDRFYTPPLSQIYPPIVPALGIPPLGPDQAFLIDPSLFVHRYNAELQHTFRPGRDLRLVWGLEAQLDEARAPGYFGSDDYFHNHLYRLFANGEWTLHPRWVANFGALVEHDDVTGTQTSPRVALNYRYADNHFMRASYTVAYRAPAMFENHVNYEVRMDNGFLIDTLYLSPNELKPEKMVSYEVGLGGQSDDRRISYEVKAFHEQLTDLIALYSFPVSPAPLLDNGAGVFGNDGTVLVRGFEAQFKFRPSERAMISLAFSHATAQGRLRENWTGTNQYGDLASATPSDTLSLLATQKFSAGWQASLGLYQIGDMTWLGGNPTGGITTADVTLRKNLKSLGAEGGLTISVRDILGAYYDYVNTVYQDRRLYVGVDVRF